MANLKSTYLSTVQYEMYTSHQSCSPYDITEYGLVFQKKRRILNEDRQITCVFKVRQKL